MKKYLGFIPVALFAVMLGCGGGGGGGGGGNGSTNGFTSGQTNAAADSTILGQTATQSNAGIEGVTVRFYDSGGTFMGSAISRANGYFDANVPSSTTRCEVDATTVPSSVLKQYTYDSKVYQAVGNGLSCNRILLPALTPGVLTPMETAMLFFPSSSPPPFPDGCF